jgi:DNA polymerase-1
MSRALAVIDFETEEITGAIPPVPVGVAVKLAGGDSFYKSWGHPSGNNCTQEEAVKLLADVQSNYDCVYHNAAFDVGVGNFRLGLDLPAVIHDTLILLFLADPHAATLSLKPSAARILGIPPDEQTALKEYILEHVPGAKKSNWGAFISKAPGDVVAPYAIQDVELTFKLFEKLHGKYKGRAYEREIKLLPILVKNQLNGIRIDVNQLEQDFEKFTAVKEKLEAHIFQAFDCEPFNLDSGDELADAIDRAGFEVKWVRTKTGKRSTSKSNLEIALENWELLPMLDYRGTLTTYLSTYMGPWLEKQVGGRMFFSWNQVRNSEDERKKFMGTRTGRLSSTPSFLNVPNAADDAIAARLGLPPLPRIRGYLLPEEGQQWLKRDYASQELRVLAHFENGVLMRQYQEMPRMDLHDYMALLLSDRLGRKIERKQTKTVAFGILYGMGNAELAKRLGCDIEMAKMIRNAYLGAVPGIKSIQNAINYYWSRPDNGKDKNFITTFGGRDYHKEPCKEVIDKNTGLPRFVDFGYKGLNYLIQGSSADITKQAIINYDSYKKDGRFLLSVHDEINISGGGVEEMRILNDCMLDIALDVRLCSDGFTGPSYGKLTPFPDSLL